MMLTNEVQVPDTSSTLGPTYKALGWLKEQKLRADKDWDINMHGGTLGYTSFFFADHRVAIQFKILFV